MMTTPERQTSVNEVPLTIACSVYDHVRDLTEHRVPVPGVKLTSLDLTIPEIAARFTAHREWEISEMGMGKYVALKSRGDTSITAIPVFPCRAFRQSAIYVRADSDLHRIEELAGLRIGIPEWAQTATIYARGFMTEVHRIDLASITWYQAGVNEPGREEKVAVQLPPGVVCEPRLDRSLNGMLLEGEVDAIVTAQAPASYRFDGGPVRRLLADARAAEEEYMRTTGIFPIMHTVAIRQDVVDAHPWVPGNLVRAFEQAKQRSVARALDPTAWRFPVPWISEYAERAHGLNGDLWPYGVDANRTTLDAFLRFAYDQGVAERRLQPEDLFVPTTLKAVRV
jgi:4,5-dihydroxyphthalate decarboxylase